MPTLTPRLGIKKPIGTENVNRASFNENYDIIDAAAAKKTDLDTHTANTSNPHNVTTTQIGAETPAGAQTKVDTHANRTDNPHAVTTTQIGAIPTSQKGAASGVATLDGSGTIPDAQIPAAITRDTELSAHTSRTDNPHSVTAAQLGALTSGSIPGGHVIPLKIPGSYVYTSATSAATAVNTAVGGGGTSGTTDLTWNKLSWNSAFATGKSIYFEAEFQVTVSGTASVGLWDITAGAIVAGSTVTTTLGAPTRVTSGAISLTQGHEYCVAIWTSANNVDCYDARLIIQ